VRFCLLKLREKGFVVRPFWGHYVVHPSVNITKGYTVVPNLTKYIHNIGIVVAVPFEGPDAPTELRDTKAETEVEGVRVRLRVHAKARKVVGWISCKEGLETVREIGLAVELFRRLLLEKTGWMCPWDRIGIKTFEAGVDYEKLRVDVPFCVTYQTFTGEALKVYAKGRGKRRHVRAEIKARPINGKTLLDFLTEKTRPYPIHVRLERVERKLDELVQAQKFLNEFVYKIYRDRLSHA